MGKDRTGDILRYMQAFDSGRKPGSITGEATGHPYMIFLSNDVSLVVAAFGQTFTVTRYTDGLILLHSKRGYLLKPQLIKDIEIQTAMFCRTEPEIIRQVISNETSKPCAIF